MKRAKVYLSVLLVLCMLSTCGISAFASEVSQFFVMINEGYAEGVSGRIYRALDEGFIIHDEVDGKLTAALIDENGVVIPKSDRLFDNIGEDGYIRCYYEDSVGYMNIKGETVIEMGEYDNIVYEGNDMFVLKNYLDEEQTDYNCALVDAEGNEIIPFGTYSSIMCTTDGKAFICEKIGDDSFSSIGVLSAEGKVIIPFDEYRSIGYLEEKNVLQCSRTVEGGTYEDAIFDTEGNVLVPFDNCYISEVDGLIKIRDKSYKNYLINWDGEIIEEITSNESVHIWDSETRYSVYNRDENKTYIRDVNGETIGVIDGSVSRRDDVGDFESFVNNVDGYWMKLTYYNEEGEVVGEVAYEDYSEYMNKHIMDDRSGVNVYVDANGITAQNDEGEVIFESSEMNNYAKFNNGTALLTNSDLKLATLINNKGDVLVPAGQYDDIDYCEALEMYAFEKDNKVYLGKICPVSVTLDGEKIEFDQNPVIKNGRTLVPVRAIFEALGASVDWNQETKTVTSVLGDKTVKLTIDSNIMYVNDTEFELDVAAEIINDRTLVPVRAVSEAFECKVGWNDAIKTVLIEK